MGSVTGPDAKGVKTVVEYKKNDKGEIVKVTTRIKTSNIEKRVYKVRVMALASCGRLRNMLLYMSTLHRKMLLDVAQVHCACCRCQFWDPALCITDSLLAAVQSQLERRKWERFGNALKETEGDSVTVRAVEDIPFERVRLQKSTQEEKKTAVDVATALAMGDKSAVGTRCGFVPVHRPSSSDTAAHHSWRPSCLLLAAVYKTSTLLSSELAYRPVWWLSD